jgi:endonuclease IV
MQIGPHISREAVPDPMNPRLWWSLANKANHTAFQTHVFNPGSLSLPENVVKRACKHDHSDIPKGGEWYFHASYFACAAPNERTAEGTATYLRNALEIAKSFGVKGIVIHTGATAGVRPVAYGVRLFEFLEKFKLFETLQSSGVELAIELGANKSELNREPGFLAVMVEAIPALGWCLDTAHCYAAGVSWERVIEVCNKLPPLVCHCNFPGSSFGSGHDVHGWRSAPQTLKVGKQVTMRSHKETQEAMEGYDNLLRLLIGKGVPLIIEGSGFLTSGFQTELDLLKELFDERPRAPAVSGREAEGVHP